jgi:hypothetical protein
MRVLQSSNSLLIKVRHQAYPGMAPLVLLSRFRRSTWISFSCRMRPRRGASPKGLGSRLRLVPSHTGGQYPVRVGLTTELRSLRMLNASPERMI